jgi:AbrB family looped-hinge helix DNA binding protein
MLQTTTITSKGQVTIPAYFRQQLGLQAGQKVSFSLSQKQPKKLVLKPIPDFLSLQGIIKTKRKYSKKAARKAISQAFARGEKL